MKIKVLQQEFSVCKSAELSIAELSGKFCFTAHTDEEDSLVCMTEDVPKNVIEREDGWRAKNKVI